MRKSAPEWRIYAEYNYLYRVMGGLRELVWLLSAGLIFLSGSSYAADMRSLYITNADGLSNSSVTCICHDSHHMVWLGTWDGLNVFNGREIRTYKHDPSDPNSLTNNIIREVVEQRPGVLWIATDNGVNRLDRKQNQIARFYFGYQKSNPLREHAFRLACSDDGMLFCAVSQYGLTCYDEKEERFVALNLPGVNLFEIEDLGWAGGCLWLLDATGPLYRTVVKREHGRIVAAEAVECAEGLHFTRIFDGGGEHLVVSDAQGGLVLLDPVTGACRRRIALARVAGRGELSAVVENDGELLLAFVEGGVYRYLFADASLTAFGELSGKAVLCMRSCEQQMIWVGTDGQGVVVQYPRHRNFGAVYNHQIQGRRNSPVRSFCMDRSGVLWVGTKGNGIFRFDSLKRPLPGSGRVTVADGLSNNSVYCIVRGSDGELLVGTDGRGVDVCPQSGDRVSHLDISLLERNDDGFGSVYSLWFDTQKKILWAGTSGYGLVRMHLERSPEGYRVVEYKKYLYDPADDNSISNNTIYSMLPDPDRSCLWIATRGGGLNRLDLAGDRFRRFCYDVSDPRSLSSNDVLSLAWGRDGALWVGTSYGLNRMMPGKKGFDRFSEQEGLPNNTIHGVLADEHGVLWITTNRGVCRLLPGGAQPVNYAMSDDLQNNEFSDGAYYAAPDGTFYMGGISGFNYFKPEHIRDRSFEPSIGITDFRVFNAPLEHYNDTYFSAPNEGIVLGPDQRFFSIGFVAYDFIDNRNCEYAYRLDGFDRDWVMAGTGYMAVFTNVPPGRYVFRVRSTNSDKVWCDNELAFPVRIRFPWWARWWAYVLYVLLAAGAGYLVYRLVRNHLDLNRALLLERLSQQRQQDIHEAKLRFFTNIAHEFCTPLTLIYSPCERLLDEGGLGGQAAKYVRTIRSNAVRMQGLIAELMNFRKVETGHRVLAFERIDLVELISCIADNFEELNRENRIDFSRTIAPGAEQTVSDRDCLEKIVFNLISNAYKYTPVGGRIDIEAGCDGQGGIRISVANTGKGIRPEDVDTVFDRFKILDNFERQVSRGNVVRTGVGLALTKELVALLGGVIRVESVLNVQTLFTVELPARPLPEKCPQPLESLPAVQPQPETPVCKSPGERATVLVVDDEPQIRELIAELFSEHYTVLQAADGCEAIDMLKNCRPSVIVCDIIMPRMDGPAFVRELKSNCFTASIPVIFLTSKIALADRISGYESGVEAYIPKPFHPRHLQAVVDRLISSRRSLKEYYNSPLSQTELYNGNYLPEKDKQFLEQLNHTIEESLQNEKTDLDHIASVLAVSRMQLYRRIRELTDMSPSEYIREVKLGRAAHLLRTTTITVQEVMYESGFNNKSYFYREFTQKFALSPREYRARHASAPVSNGVADQS